jgi:hypothetical protein
MIDPKNPNKEDDSLIPPPDEIIHHLKKLEGERSEIFKSLGSLVP